MRGQQSYQNSAEAERRPASKREERLSTLVLGGVVLERQREVVPRESRQPPRGQGCAEGGVKGQRRESESAGVWDEQ